MANNQISRLISTLKATLAGEPQPVDAMGPAPAGFRPTKSYQGLTDVVSKLQAGSSGAIELPFELKALEVCLETVGANEQGRPKGWSRCHALGCCQERFGLQIQAQVKCQGYSCVHAHPRDGCFTWKVPNARAPVCNMLHVCTFLRPARAIFQYILAAVEA